MKILAICGSPRSGNTLYLLEQILGQLHSKQLETEIIQLSKFSIKRCTGCLVCEETNCSGNCTIKDDMSKILYQKILESDVLIFGSPSYFDMPTGLMKTFMDRTNAILNKMAEKKYNYGIVVVGQSEIVSLKSVCDSIRKYCSICQMKEITRPLQIIARDVHDAEKKEDIATLISSFVNAFKVIFNK
jgi:multimeric flavodoxin WrbA